VTALVTGASGLLGAHLVTALLQRGVRVRALHLPEHPIDPEVSDMVETLPGDVRDRSAVARALRRCQLVFHAAGFVSYWRGDAAALREVHVEGTRNVVEEALAGGVDRLVYTSTVATLGYCPERPADETHAYNLGYIGSAYLDCKRLAEQLVIGAVARGLPAIVVNPGGLIGDGAVHMPTLSLMRRLRDGLVPGFPGGGVNVVDAADVATGHILAAENGRVGERYILGGENLKHRDILALTAEAVGARPPLRRLPAWSLRMAGWAAEMVASVTGRSPTLITRTRAALAELDLYYRSDRAAVDLGYRPHAVRPAIARAFRWYVQHGHL
jgi:dihydroflavonol-4-reductase